MAKRQFQLKLLRLEAIQKRISLRLKSMRAENQIGGDPKKNLLKIEIYEGRKREVKRMFQAIGHKVLQLQRINFGGLRLGNLKMGNWRFLTRKEIDSLKKQVALK